jgi:hypothetical protein
MVVIVPPNKTAADGMVGVSELIDKQYPANKKVMILIWNYYLYFSEQYFFVQV